MKKILCVLLALTFALTCNTAFAQPSSNEVEQLNGVSEVKVNEYQALKKLKAMSTDELKTSGYNAEQILEIKKIDYAQEIKKRAELPKDQLRNLGYTEEQINILKDFKGTEQEMIAAAAVLTLSASKSVYYYYSQDNNTLLKIQFQWIWDHAPIMQFKDMIAFTWVPSAMRQDSGQTSHTVRYYNYNGDFVKSRSWAVDPQNPGVGSVSKFNMQDVYGSNLDYCWAKTGSGYFTISGVGRNAVACRIAYGHTVFNLIPSVSFPGILTITFGSYVTTEDVWYANYGTPPIY